MRFFFLRQRVEAFPFYLALNVNVKPDTAWALCKQHSQQQEDSKPKMTVEDKQEFTWLLGGTAKLLNLRQQTPNSRVLIREARKEKQLLFNLLFVRFLSLPAP